MSHLPPRRYHGGLRELSDAHRDVTRLLQAMRSRALATVGLHGDEHEHGLWLASEASLASLAEYLNREIAQAVQQHPVGPWLNSIPGVTAVHAGAIIGYVRDARKFATISKLWRYSGYATFDGVAEKRKRGVKAHFVPNLKATLYAVGLGMVREHAGYRRLFDDAYARYFRDRPTWSFCRVCKTITVECRSPAEHGSLWSTSRVAQAARRRMLKVFLSNLWVVWHAVYGTPVPRRPYAHDVLGHETYQGPEEFVGWPVPPIVYS